MMKLIRSFIYRLFSDRGQVRADPASLHTSNPLFILTAFWVFSGNLCRFFRVFLALMSAVGFYLFTG